MMKTKPLYFHLILLPLCVAFSGLGEAVSFAGDGEVALVIHGGASSAGRENRIGKNEKEHREILDQSLLAGYTILEKGGSSLDAVEAAIVVLENSPLFNAGKGAVFTLEGKSELDASIMDGKKMKAGAVGGVTTVKNPIHAARAVMDKTWHVFLTGKGAETFAREVGLELVEPEYFRSEAKWREYQRGLQEEKSKAGKSEQAAHHLRKPPTGDSDFGTVGAVALDSDGNIAAGTSTGGMMYKKFGRIGDSPIIGAGTYADNTSCGISCTGQGEYFIRRAIAFDISARMKYQNISLQEAAKRAIKGTLNADGGKGGIIGIDHEGNIVVEYNSYGIVWGSINTKGAATINLGSP